MQLAVHTGGLSEHEDQSIDTVPGQAVDGRTADDVEAVMAAARVLVAVSAQSVAAVAEEVTLPQLRVLVMVASRGQLNLGGVAEGIGVHLSNATRVVDRLVRAGFLHREDDPNDRRNLIVRLTSDGHQLVDRIMNERRVAIADILRRMPSTRRRALMPVMRSFASSAARCPPTPCGRSAGPPPHDRSIPAAFIARR